MIRSFKSAFGARSTGKGRSESVSNKSKPKVSEPSADRNSIGSSKTKKEARIKRLPDQKWPFKTLHKDRRARAQLSYLTAKLEVEKKAKLNGIEREQKDREKTAEKKREMLEQNIKDLRIEITAADIGETPLTTAVDHGDEASIRILLRSGADIEKRDVYGRTPLMRSVRIGDFSIIKRLLESGADAFAENSEHCVLSLSLSLLRNEMQKSSKILMEILPYISMNFRNLCEEINKERSHYNYEAPSLRRLQHTLRAICSIANAEVDAKNKELMDLCRTGKLVADACWDRIADTVNPIDRVSFFQREYVGGDLVRGRITEDTTRTLPQALADHFRNNAKPFEMSPDMQDFKKAFCLIRFNGNDAECGGYQRHGAAFKNCASKMIEKCVSKMSVADITDLILTLSADSGNTVEPLGVCLNSLGEKLEEFKDIGVEIAADKVIDQLNLAYHRYIKKMMVSSAMRVMRFVEKHDPTRAPIGGLGV